MVVTAGVKYLFVHKVILIKNLKRGHPRNKKKNVNVFFMHVANIWRTINTIAIICHENLLLYLSLDIICSSNRTVFLELRSRKTVRANQTLFLFMCFFLSLVKSQHVSTEFIHVVAKKKLNWIQYHLSSMIWIIYLASRWYAWFL